jgi:two-component system LytT family sensor kinase
MKKVRELLQHIQSALLINISWEKLLFESKYRNAIVPTLWVINSLIIYGVFSFSYSSQKLGYVYILILIVLSPFTYYLFGVLYGKWQNFYGAIISVLIILFLHQTVNFYSISFLSRLAGDGLFTRVLSLIGYDSFWNALFSKGLFFVTYTNSLFSILPLLVFSLLYQLAVRFYYNQKLQEENLKLEISYLHAQINPHFLLNTLTAIYNMVMDNPKASKSIETLSGLLHYSLYDTGSEKVPLDKEVQFIKDYIKLARIRLNRNKKLKLTIIGNPKGLTIAPLILVNLVENCIKHGLHRVSGAAEAEVTITIEKDTIYLSTYNKTPDLSGTTGGIGLHNTCRRLNIYYPDKHELEIVDENGIYRVNLSINLMQ